MLARWPELSESDGGLGRLTDVAFDVAEYVQVDADVVQAALDFARGEGARTSLSSIHLHVTFDVDDKATGALHFLAQAFGRDPTHSRSAFAFVGDSENDAPAFAAFETTIGVSNFRGRMTKPPRFATSKPRGAGFAEAAQRLLGLRA
jgi:hydroxymethylpyrimidine pyrophosphatase-like HAD family hydrolase